MNETTTTYGRLASIFAVISSLTFFLAMVELPRSDGIDGPYLNFFLEFAVNRPTEPLELRATSPFDITERRIISVLLVSAIFSSIVSVSAGLWASRRREEPRNYAGSVAISVVFLVILIQYGRLIAW